ncbi:MAG: ribosome-binding factor A [Alphaproteobacteria bacterium]|nr:MAG: ribosome-binding factor A [Alphaproteobacteria bacterium]
MKNRKTNSNEPSQRMLRVGEQLRHLLSETLQRGHFSNEMLLNKSNMIIVSEVRPSPDLKHARAYVMSINGDSMDELLPALNEQAHVFQKEIGRSSNLKFTPKVKFVTDTSFDEAQHIENLLRDVRKSDDEDSPEE